MKWRKIAISQVSFMGQMTRVYAKDSACGWHLAGLITSLLFPGLVVHTCKPCTAEDEAGRCQVQGTSGQLCETIKIKKADDVAQQ